MKLTVHLSDDVIEQYRSYQRDRSSIGELESILTNHLTRFSEVAPQDRILLVDAKSRGRLEKSLSGGHIKDPADLATRVERIVGLKLGGVDLDFTPTQKASLKAWAEKNHLTYEQGVSRVVKQLEPMFFNVAG